MILGTKSSRNSGQQEYILRETAGTGPVLLQVCAPLVRVGHSSLMAVLDLISEVGCGNYREKNSFKVIGSNQSKDQRMWVCGYLLSK